MMFKLVWFISNDGKVVATFKITLFMLIIIPHCKVAYILFKFYP